MDQAFVDKYTTQSLAGTDILDQTRSGIREDIGNIPAALASTVVDVGTALWNSAVVGIPKLLGADTSEYSASTFDLLDAVNSDWSNFYRQHEEAVQTASFVAGSLIAGGIALKGMKMMQAGKLAMYPSAINDASQAARITKLTSMMESASASTTQFNALRWQILGVDALQQTAQAAGMEVMVLATFNEHPFLEDYFKDPVRNFGISVALGSVIGAGFSQISLRSTLAKELGAVSSASVSAVKNELTIIPHGITEVDKVQRLRANVQQLDNLANSQNVTPLTRELAKDAKTWMEGEAAIIERDRIFGPTLKGADQTTKEQVRTLISSDSAFGANTVDLVTFAPEELSAKTRFSSIFRSQESFKEAEAIAPELMKLGQQVRQGVVSSLELERTVPNWKQLMEKSHGVYYSPHFGAYIPLQDAKQYVRAVDTGRKAFESKAVLRINPDIIDELVNRGTTTALADRAWIDALGSAHAVEGQSKVFMHSTDLPTINAWLSRASFNEAHGIKSPLRFFMTDAVGVSQDALKTSAREVSLGELTEHLAKKKTELARSLLENGASFQEMSIRLNTDVTTLERLFLERKAITELPGWRQYVNVDDIDKVYLSQKTQMLKLTTNGSRVASLQFRNADLSAQLDQKALKVADRGAMQDAIRSVGSPEIEELFLTLNRDNAHWDMLDARLADVVNSKAGSFFFSSSDMATRRMGDVSAIASVAGQKYIGVNNLIAKNVLTDLSATIHAHTASQAGLNELNAIFNHLAGISGYRNFNPKTGELFARIAGPDGALYEKVIKASDIKGLLGSEISSGARAVLTEMQKVSEKMYKIKNSLNRIQGYKELDNIGLHIPTYNPNNKFISYVIDTNTQDMDKKVRMLVAKTPDELASLEKRWLAENPVHLRKGVDLVTKSQQEAYNAIKMRLDPMDMDYVDVNRFHSGASASAVTLTDDSLTATLIENLHGRILHYSRQIQEMYLHDTMSTLDVMSAINRKLTDAQPIAAKSVGTFQGEDAARAVKNMILGNNQLSNFSTWRNFNNGFSATVDYVSAKVTKMSHAFSKEIDPKMPLGQKDYVKFSKELEQVGLRNPFQDFNDYMMFEKTKQTEIGITEKLRKAPIAFDLEHEVAASDEFFRTSRRELAYSSQLSKLRTDAVARLHGIDRPSAEQLIAAGNSVLSTLALRLLELGQPFVNAISMPILGIPELMRNMPKTFLGNEATRVGVGVAFPARTIYDGIRWYHSDAAKPWIARWVKEGFGQSIVSEATQINQMIYKEGRGTLGKITNLLQKKDGIVALLSKPSDVMERETRLWALSIGFQAARTAYPTITDEAANIFAINFLNKVIGNYHAAQRPALFQGTAGVALGLFQTYFLTWSQAAYRSIEEGAGKALAAQMLIQAGLFGTSSLPGYDLFSKTIASNFSDKHYDLTTGTYRALPTPLAEFVVYGLPASLGIGLYTRGDLQPRIPVVSQANPIDQIAAINVARQMYGTVAHTITKTLEAQGATNKVRGFLEGLSMQSLSRPIARIAEAIPLPDGEGGLSAVGALSRQGNTIATSSEVWSMPGLFSRVLSSRSAEEAVKREMDYMSSFHATLDTQNRKAATENLKTAIRGGTLSEPNVLETISRQYLRSGTATGWQAAVNEALATSNGGIDYKLEKRIGPTSPLQQMIKDNF